MSEDTSSYDGVEQVNETLRHYLRQLPPPLPPISHILTILLDHFLPALYARHVEDSADLHLSLDPDLTPEGSRTHDNPSKPSEDFAHKCREVVDHIRSYTYLVKDQHALQGLYDSLLVSYENILQHNKDRRKIERKIQLEGVESVDSGSQKESPASPGLPSSKPLEMVANSESKSLGKVLVKPSSKQHTLPRDIVGSYIVHNNILELMKTEVPHTPEHGEEEEPEPQFSASSKVIRTYSNNNMGKKEQKMQEKSSTLERLKLIPPEVFKLLMPADEKSKPSRCSAETLDTKDKMLTKTFRILIPVPVKNKKRSNSPSADQEMQLEKKSVDDSTLTSASITANPKRKQRKCYDIDSHRTACQ